MVPKNLVSVRFSRKAASYVENARVQTIMARQTADLCPLDQRLPPGDILDIGCGTGALTGHLVRKYPERSILALDIAPGMIEQARQSITDPRVSFLCGDAETADLGGPYALIASSAAFQWMHDLPALFQKLHQSLLPGGCLVFSTFGPRTFASLRSAYEKAARETHNLTCRYNGLDFMGRTELESTLARSFAPGKITFRKKMERTRYPSARDFLRAVSRVGASGPREKTAPPELARRLLSIYEQENRWFGQVEAHYETFYFTAGRM